MDNTEIVERLIEIKEQMLKLLEEATEIIPDGITKDRAMSYWYPHIKTALTKRHDYIAGWDLTLEDTINEVSEEESEEETE